MAIISGGGGRSRGRSSRRQAAFTDINITPLTDVVLVLLIIFMVTAQFIDKADTGMQVNLPSASNVEDITSLGGLHVSVSKEGQFTLDGQPVTPESLQAELVRTRTSPQQMIILEGDGQTAYQNILVVEDAALGAGMPNVYRATAAKQPAPGEAKPGAAAPAKPGTDTPFASPVKPAPVKP